MSKVKLKGGRRLFGARSPGQSLPLIGMMIVILTAAVGLSVDVGNTFQTERRAVAAGNAASIAGFNTYLRRTSSTTNQMVYTTIINTLRSNGVEVAAPGTEPVDGQLELEAYYLDPQGRRISNAAPEITNNTSTVPNNVGFIQVNLVGRVDTYFARVVGRPDLPIGATSYAGVCPSTEGFYPIGISNQILQGNRFKNPGDANFDGVTDMSWQELPSGHPYAGFTAMKVAVKNGTPGGFSWLAWEDKANNARDLEAALAIPGSLGAGFEEAPWPLPPTPEDYPDKPGQLNAGDWVRGATGYMQSSDNLMDIHVTEGTRMILPIYNQVQGQGNNHSYEVVDFGVFILLDHGNEKIDGNQPQKFIELIFLGRDINQGTSCSFSSAPDPAQTYSLVGDVSIRPEYAFYPSNRQPIQYVVVLDVSGSMSANFAGQCDQSRWGTNNRPARGWWQCSNGPEGAPATEVSGTGPDYWWGNQEQRRITVAKRALESLVRSTNMQGNTSYEATRPEDQMAVIWYNSNVGRTTGNITVFPGGSNFSSTVGNETSGLIGAIRSAGSVGGDAFRSQGGTNGAAGLYRASLAFDAQPKTTQFNGRTVEYKRVVIFITDGVSNTFLNKSDGNLNGGSSRRETYVQGHVCRVDNVVEIASCQITGNATMGGGVTTGIGGVAAGMDRPITQAGNVSKDDLQSKGIEVYAIALSNIPATGLQDAVASFPKNFFSAANLQVVNGQTNVQSIMEVINTEVRAGVCQERSDALDGGEAYRSTIPVSHFVSTQGFVYPNVGQVILQNVENDAIIQIPVTADSSGKITYRKSDVPRGSYRMQVQVWYRHPLDPAGTLPRLYSTFDGGLTADSVLRVGTGTASGGSLNAEVRQDVQLRLTGSACGN